MEKLNSYPTVVPYLILKNGARFIDFLEMVFSADLQRLTMRDESSIIMNAELSIGSSIIMFADETSEWKAQNASLFITVKDADEVFQKALDHGATIVNDLSNQEYGRGGGVKDPWGNIWWITGPAK